MAGPSFRISAMAVVNSISNSGDLWKLMGFFVGGCHTTSGLTKHLGRTKIDNSHGQRRHDEVETSGEEKRQAKGLEEEWRVVFEVVWRKSTERVKPVFVRWRA